jgi:predicted secreted protein
MSISFLIAVYFVLWWVVLFAVLPFGVRTQAEAGEVVPGTPASAPASFPLLRVFAVTTLVAALVFAALWALIALRIIDVDALMSAPKEPR